MISPPDQSAEFLLGFASAAATFFGSLYWGMYRGWLLTGREGREKNETIREQRETIREVLSQNTALIDERRAAVAALEAMRRVAEGQAP